MKVVLIFISVCSFLLDQGVSDVGSDPVQKLVKKGDPVTLHTGAEINQQNRVTWYFNDVRIAYINGDLSKICTDDQCEERFRDRLKLDHQTGSLTIMNTRTTDSGEYTLLMSGSSSGKIFSVTVIGVFGDEVKSVKEGDHVTLNTDVIKPPTKMMLWYFNDRLIALISGHPETSCLYDGEDGRFRDRLEVDYETGSLIITDITTQHTGRYEAEYDKENKPNKIETLNRPVNEKRCGKAKDTKKGDLGKIIKSYSLTVSDYVESVSVQEGDNVPLRTGLTGTERIEQIRWTFGDDGKFIADLNGPVNKDNFGLNKQTGDLTIRNIQRDQSGLYKVEIKTRTMILHRKYKITVVALPDPGWSSAAVAGIFVGGVGVGLLLAAAAFYYCYKKYKKELSEKQLSVLYEQLKVIHMRKEASKTQQCESAGSGPKNSSIPMAVEELYEKLEELFKNQSQLSGGYVNMADEHVPLNSNVIYVQDHPPSRNNGEVEELYEKLADDTENVSMKNLCGSQSAGSDTENSPFREIKGNKEHGYDIL